MKTVAGQNNFWNEHPTKNFKFNESEEEKSLVKKKKLYKKCIKNVLWRKKEEEEGSYLKIFWTV